MKPNFKLLRRAAEIIDGIPDNRFNLDTVFEKGHCGTIGCAMGWLAHHPEFNKLGYTYSFGQVRINSNIVDIFTAAERLFHIQHGDAYGLFVGVHVHHSRNHKVLFRQRVIRFLEKHGQPVSTEYKLSANL